MAGIPVLVLGNKRDLPGALDEHGLIEKMNLNAIQVGSELNPDRQSLIDECISESRTVKSPN